jgi:hypothetical protein
LPSARLDGDDRAMPVSVQRLREFVQQYARARELQADYHIDEIVEIADDSTNDYMQDKDSAGYKLNGEHIQRARLRVDTRKWVASKLAPKKYGDKLDLNQTGQMTINIGKEYDGA